MLALEALPRTPQPVIIGPIKNRDPVSKDEFS